MFSEVSEKINLFLSILENGSLLEELQFSFITYNNEKPFDFNDNQQQILYKLKYSKIKSFTINGYYNHNKSHIDLSHLFEEISTNLTLTELKLYDINCEECNYTSSFKKMIINNKTLNTIIFNNIKLNAESMKYICKSLYDNETIINLNIQSNYYTYNYDKYIIKLLTKKKTLQILSLKKTIWII